MVWQQNIPGIRLRLREKEDLVAFPNDFIQDDHVGCSVITSPESPLNLGLDAFHASCNATDHRLLIEPFFGLHPQQPVLSFPNPNPNSNSDQHTISYSNPSHAIPHNLTYTHTTPTNAYISISTPTNLIVTFQHQFFFPSKALREGGKKRKERK